MLSTIAEPTLSFSITQLRGNVQGEVLLPSDEGYDDARKAWNLTVDQHPAVIVVARDEDDVIAAVRFAVREDLKIAVQSTGHGIVRNADHALLIVTSNLDNVWVDPLNHTAWLEAGVKWQAVLDQSCQYGLAPLLGSSPTVGAVGYTLGGGMGWLARKYGMALDSVLEFEIVTPEGELTRASSSQNPDLFWALRGGGGNFGVVTAMKIQLFPVTDVYGGNLVYPAEMAREVLQRYNEWIATVPNELTSGIFVITLPLLPQVPEFLRGKSVVMVRGCYAGSLDEGKALVDSWRHWHTPMIDDFKVMPFSQVATISNDPVDPSPGKSTGGWLHDLDADTADILLRATLPTNGPTPVAGFEIRHAGGVIAAQRADTNAYGNRSGRLILHMLGMVMTPPDAQAFAHFTDQVKQELGTHLTGGIYMNFTSGEEARARTKDAFTPDNLTRLAAIKAKFDVENRFAHSYVFAAENAPEGAN